MSNLEDYPFRDDPCAEVREKLNVAEALIMSTARERDEARADAARTKVLMHAIGAYFSRIKAVGLMLLGVSSATIVVMCIVSMAPSCSHPSPSPGERMNAARTAAASYFEVLYPGETSRVVCVPMPKNSPMFEGEDPYEGHFDQSCLALVRDHSFSIICSGQIGGANQGCHDMHPTTVR